MGRANSTINMMYRWIREKIGPLECSRWNIDKVGYTVSQAKEENCRKGFKNCWQNRLCVAQKRNSFSALLMLTDMLGYMSEEQRNLNDGHHFRIFYGYFKYDSYYIVDMLLIIFLCRHYIIHRLSNRLLYSSHVLYVCNNLLHWLYCY